MRVCLIAPGPSEAGSPGHSPRLLAELLSRRHEVTLIHSGYTDEPPQQPPAANFREVYATLPEELQPLKFACEDHRHSAAAMETLRRLYGDGGPDYLELCDFRAHGLVALQARRAGDPLLAGTTIAVRISPSTELRNLHDSLLQQPANRRLADLEREQLRLADRLLWPGGDCLGVYQRYYAGIELPPGARIRPPVELPAEPPAPAAGNRDPRLRLLFVGDLRRSTGALDLVEACQLLPPESWSLTLIGRDSRTAPIGQSVRETAEAISGESGELVFEEEPPDKLSAARLAAADLLVVPARLEASSAVALAAMAAGVPVLATPVGELGEAVGDAGWITADVGATALGRALARLEDDRTELERVRASGAPRRRALELADPERTLDAYDELLASAPDPAAVSVEEQPLVTGIVPYFHAHEYVAEAVASLLEQTYPRVEVLIVNDGSFEPADAILDELAADPRVRVVTQVNRGEGTARTLAARVAAGEYVVMLDADNVLEPTFVERTLAVLRRQPDLAYVTCWLRMIGADGRDTSIHPGFAPLGNSVLEDDSENWDGDTLAMLPRRVFTELGFEFHPEGSMHSDWQLYRSLRRGGAYGAVIPERLARYRVLEDSLIRAHPQELQDHSWRESGEQMVLAETRWTAEVPA
ncbi:MAG TPA: glycosyltransferase [Solirubrobacterales bacterium]|nr:glycosyltransferase [Solirubrobacterales bacterium]